MQVDRIDKKIDRQGDNPPCPSIHNTTTPYNIIDTKELSTQFIKS